MIKLDLGNDEILEINNLILDYNGTIAFDGETIKGVKERLNKLKEYINIYILTADTFGTVKKEFNNTDINIKIIKGNKLGSDLKEDFIKKLGENNSIAIGNGLNDKKLLEKAIISIAIIGREGVSIKSLNKADLAIYNIVDALDLLLNKNRLKASLRK
ncbi:MAG: HAD family hydrolase [Bacillota bacterium]